MPYIPEILVGSQMERSVSVSSRPEDSVLPLEAVHLFLSEDSDRISPY